MYKRQLSVAVGVAGEVAWAEGFGWADLEARVPVTPETQFRICLLYTSDAADERSSVDLGGRRIIKKKKK